MLGVSCLLSILSYINTSAKFPFADEFIIKQRPLKSKFFPEGVGFFTGAAPEAGGFLFAEVTGSQG